MDSKIKPVNPIGNQPWIFILKTDAEAEAPILWPPDVKSWLTGKDLDAGKDWGQEEMDITDSMDMSLSKLQEVMKDQKAMQSIKSQRVRHDHGTEQQHSLLGN